MKRTIVSIALVVCLTNGGLLLTDIQKVYGFKVDTHIWIAQQILNDLGDGTLSIRRGDELLEVPVNESVRAAILTHQAFYRMGHIGPDAFPGIFDGQMTVHPGSQKGGWGTGDWLAHLLQNAQTPQELAFAYGFLGHAAADVFAHTYVNQYAGDIYLLTDGETHVEKRHVVLENYIAKHSPALGVELKDLIIHNNNLAVPADLLWRAFIANGIAAQELAASDSSHLADIYNLDQTLAQLTAKDGPFDKLHILSQQLVVFYLTSYTISDADLRRVNEVHQQLRDWTNDQIDNAQAVDKAISEELLRIFKKDNKIILDHLDQAHKVLSKLPELAQAKHQAAQNVLRAREDLNKEINRVCEKTSKEICKVCPKFDPLCKVTCEPITEIICKYSDPAYLAAKAALDLAQEIEQRAIKQLSDELNFFRDSLKGALTAAETALQHQINILHAAIDLIQRFHKDVDPVSGLFKAWRSDIEKSMKAYFFANAEAIRNTMTGDDALKPLTYWRECSFPSILGIAIEVVDLHCNAKGLYEEIIKALDELERLASISDPILRPIVLIKKEINDKLTLARTKAIFLFAEKATGEDVEYFLNLMKEVPSKDLLDQIFLQRQGPKPILLIERASDRVDAEMDLKDGKFSPDKYAVVFNAIVLSKMSLLDAKSLNIIANEEVYSGKDLATNNVMIRFPFSIDGNHHWLKDAPPYPRASGEHAGGKHYGYSEGFALWKTRKMRSQVFRQIFIGPLSPGIELPILFGLPEVLPSSYDYRPTVECPFPNYPNPDSCRYSQWDRFLDWLDGLFRY